MNSGRIAVAVWFVIIAAIIPLVLADAPSGSTRRSQRPVAGQKIDDKMVTDLETQARQCETPREALDLYLAFQQQYTVFSPHQAETLAERQKIWRGRVDAGLVRSGVKWVTLDEAKAVAKKAQELIDEGFKRIDEREYKRAKELFDRAIVADPEGIRAGYLMGMLNSPNFANWPFGAEKYFEQMLRREPKHVGLLNNLALTEVRMGKYSEALDHWSDALRLTENGPEITQNLGRFIAEANDKKFRTTASHVKRATSLYVRAIEQKKGEAVDVHRGWLYCPLCLSTTEQQRSSPPKSDQKVYVGSGTGFVVHAQYVLTNRHVADGSEALSIVDPKQPGKEYAATVVAISKDHDLAILRCDQLIAPAVTLHPQLPARSSDVLVLGYPLASILGSSQKSVRGPVYGLKNNDSVVLYEAATNPGNSGGPVCDNTGTVVAVHFAGIDLSVIERSDGKLGCGIPTTVAIPFVQEHLPELVPKKLDTVLSWPEVDAKVSQSTVMIKIFQSPVEISAKRQDAGQHSVYEDRSCSVCRGRARIPCQVRGCARGASAASETTQSFERVGDGKSVIIESKTKTLPCRQCGGSGFVDCPGCANGMDPKLR